MPPPSVIRLSSASPDADVRALQEVDDFDTTDMGCKGEKWAYRKLKDEQITPEIIRHCQGHGTYGSVDHVSLQPCQSYDARSQDRYIVQTWDIPGSGQWTFSAVFDGHGSHGTVDYVVENLPARVKTTLYSLLSSRSASPSAIERLLSDAIVQIDNAITQDFLRLFPMRPEVLENMKDSDVAAHLKNHRISPKSQAILRCMEGSTALLTLVDPSMTHLWVANLGDCRAVLVSKTAAGSFKARSLSEVHNGGNQQELRRIRNEHPGEGGCVVHDRVLGFLAPTRAIGDTWMKLPAAYSRKVLRRTREFWNSNITDTNIDRIKTPPYVSNSPQVVYEKLRSHRMSPTSGDVDVALILCSDGLVDLYEDQDISSENAMLQRWASKVGEAITPQARSPRSGQGLYFNYNEGGSGRTNVALHLLRDAIGGADLKRVSENLTVEREERWMDDTTILVHQFL